MSRLLTYPLILLSVPLLTIVLTQDLQLFPGALEARLSDLASLTVPAGIQASRLITPDGANLEVWRKTADTPRREDLRGIIFHGNGGWVGSTYDLQHWLSGAGVESYAFDYRGYGRSSGWPSERNIYSDSDALWATIGQESDLPIRPVVVGISMGGAPAARFAAKYRAHTLLLISAFTSLRDVVSNKPFFRHLAPLLWYRFPTKDYVSQLTGTCTIVAHGENDTVVPVSQGRELFTSAAEPKKLIINNSDHNTVFYDANDQLTAALKLCLDTAPALLSDRP